jgi:hypothetical protein
MSARSSSASRTVRRRIARWRGSRAKKGRPRWTTLLDIFDDRRGSGERETAVDQVRHAATRVERPESAVYKSPASN